MSKEKDDTDEMINWDAFGPDIGKENPFNIWSDAYTLWERKFGPSKHDEKIQNR